MTGIEALESFRQWLDLMVESNVNYDQRAAFNYAAGEAERRAKEIRAEEAVDQQLCTGGGESRVIGG